MGFVTSVALLQTVPADRGGIAGGNPLRDAGIARAAGGSQAVTPGRKKATQIMNRRVNAIVGRLSLRGPQHESGARFCHPFLCSIVSIFRSQGTSGNSPRSRDAFELAGSGRLRDASLTDRLGNLPYGTTTLPHAARNETFQSRARWEAGCRSPLPNWARLCGRVTRQWPQQPRSLTSSATGRFQRHEV